ncbi:hypothetical protein ACLESD_13865 [Pyxidicoccus sp. 3LFB2]
MGGRHYGCSSSLRAAVSNVVEFSKPDNLHAATESDADEPTDDVEVAPVDNSMMADDVTDGQ